MSAQIKDGGPAFPAEGPSVGQFESYGMTLRDYFAAKATDADIEAARYVGENPDDPWARCLCRFRYADAMLRAREVQS